MSAIAVFKAYTDRESEIEFLTNELQKANVRIAGLHIVAARAPELPIEVRKLPRTDGWFALVNRASEPLPVSISIDGGEKIAFVIPKAKAWLVSEARSGQKVEVSSQGFDPILVTPK